LEVERAAFVMKPSSDIPILRATNDEVLRADPLSKVAFSSARASWYNLLVEAHRIPCNLGLEQLREGDGRAYLSKTRSWRIYSNSIGLISFWTEQSKTCRMIAGRKLVEQCRQNRSQGK
jgi:hypothetical protein